MNHSTRYATFDFQVHRISCLDVAAEMAAGAGAAPPPTRPLPPLAEALPLSHITTIEPEIQK